MCLTLMADADTGRNNLRSAIAEDAGSKTSLVTVTLTGIRFGTAKEVTVVGGGTATEGTDYTAAGKLVITISAGRAPAATSRSTRPTTASTTTSGPPAPRELLAAFPLARKPDRLVEMARERRLIRVLSKPERAAVLRHHLLDRRESQHPEGHARSPA